MNQPNILPLAGLASYEEAARPGLTVDNNVERLRRYNRVKTSLYKVSAAFLNPTPEWEVKCALSLHLYLDAQHSLALRGRVSELRKPPHHLDDALAAPFEEFLEEALRAKDTVELVAGVYGVLHPALRDAYQTHLEAINPVFDFPTARILRQMLPEEEQMIAWGAQALAALTTDATDNKSRADAWQAHLRAYLAAAGGISGLEPVLETGDLPAPRATEPFIANTEPQRDARSGAIHNFYYRANDVYQDPEADWDERNLALMFKRLHEMDVPEMMASIVLQTPGRAWEYYADMARQLWDEARHAMMGEVWFAKYGIDWGRYDNHVGWSLHLNQDRTPLERHIILYFIEQSLMNGETGKRWEWKIAQTAGDPLATYLQDYDWADEVLHAQVGRKWLKPEVGNVKMLLETAREIAERPSPTLEARRALTVQKDWWPRLVRDVLGKESTSVAGTNNSLIPVFAANASG